MVYIVVATKYITKWAEAKAVKTDMAAHATTFMYENIISRFGCAKILGSNMGTHFLIGNSLIGEMTDQFQIDHRKTTPYHPQTYDQTERVNGILVNILKNRLGFEQRLEREVDNDDLGVHNHFQGDYENYTILTSVWD